MTKCETMIDLEYRYKFDWEKSILFFLKAKKIMTLEHLDKKIEITHSFHQRILHQETKNDTLINI